jgi:endo-1,4-beta-xylanase
MESYTELGLEVAITELDVRNPQPENATILEGQKQAYAAATGACMQVDRCVGITVWDFYDPVSAAFTHSETQIRRNKYERRD